MDVMTTKKFSSEEMSDRAQRLLEMIGEPSLARLMEDFFPHVDSMTIVAFQTILLQAAEAVAHSKETPLTSLSPKECDARLRQEVVKRLDSMPASFFDDPAAGLSAAAKTLLAKMQDSTISTLLSEVRNRYIVLEYQESLHRRGALPEVGAFQGKGLLDRLNISGKDNAFLYDGLIHPEDRFDHRKQLEESFDQEASTRLESALEEVASDADDYHALSEQQLVDALSDSLYHMHARAMRWIDTKKSSYHPEHPGSYARQPAKLSLHEALTEVQRREMIAKLRPVGGNPAQRLQKIFEETAKTLGDDRPVAEAISEAVDSYVASTGKEKSNYRH